MNKLSSSFLLATIVIAINAQTPAAPPPLEHSSQLIVVVTSDWNAVDGRLQRFARSTTAAGWEPVGDPVTIVAGKGGMGWGAGVDSIDTARSVDDPAKRGGDHKSPAGIFRLGTAFGYDARPPGAWKLSYLPLTPAIDCVDDPQSPQYNQVVDHSAVTPSWRSAEHMRNEGDSYKWGLVIEQNMYPTRSGAGSCVFLHVWSGAGVGTEGCTAMPLEELLPILGWLDPKLMPLLVQMPLSQYRQAQKPLHLPSLPTSIDH